MGTGSGELCGFTASAHFEIFVGLVFFLQALQKQRRDGAEMLGKQQLLQVFPQQLWKLSSPKCPDLLPWPPLVRAVSKPSAALPRCFLHEGQLLLSINLSTDQGKSRGDGVSCCWSLQHRADCEQGHQTQK